MKKNNILPEIKNVVKKTHGQIGKWIAKPLRSTIVVCACGNKYIVTRKGQKECMKCIYSRGTR